MSVTTPFDKLAIAEAQPKSIRVAIADDHYLFVIGLIEVLKEQTNIEICASFTQANELIKWYKGINADIIMISLDIPSSDGINICKRILRRFPFTKFMLLSNNNSSKLRSALNDLGTNYWLPKSVTPDTLKTAIEKIHFDSSVISNLCIDSTMNHNHEKKDSLLLQISNREMQVLNFIKMGKSNSQIAHEMCVSPLTVKKHRENLLRKFHAPNTARMIADAYSLGLF